MDTFGKFFENLRRRIEGTGRTDAQCSYMDDYKRSYRASSAGRVGKEDSGWEALGDQELSHWNLLEFSREMSWAGVNALAMRLASERFDPDYFRWRLDSVHEFHHAMLEEAKKCGLDVDSPSAWTKARNERKHMESARN
jgi:hypothetical protein